jgi:hypothetical protein
MNSAFRAVKGDDGILAYTGSTFPITKGKYREYNKIFYRSKQTITGGTFNATFWDVIGVTSGSSVSIGLVTTGGLTGSTVGSNLNIGLGNSGVGANTYFYPQFTVDVKGRISSATSRTAFSGFTGTAGITGTSSGAGSGKILQVGLGNTSVTPGTYHRASIIVDQKGRITLASGNTLAGINGISVTGNTINLNTTAVSPGTYQLATVTVDSRGRITFASGNTASAGGGTPAIGVNGSIQFKQGSALSGSSQFIYQNLSRALTIGTRNAGVTGSTSFTIGTGNVAQNTTSIAIGSSNVSSGIVSFVVGQTNVTASNYAILFGSGNTVNTSNDYAFVAGRLNLFNSGSQNSTAIGLGNIVQSSYAMAIGFKNQVGGLGAFAGGYNESAGGNRPNIANGKASFIYSYTDTSQTSGHGALAPFSAILGGRNNNIATPNTGATIIGGNSIKLSSAGYEYYTAVSNLVINDPPNNGTIIQDVLSWDSTSKKVLKVAQDVISPQYNSIAWVSPSGSDSTGTIRIARKPFLTIQAAVTALVSGAAPSSTNRCLVVAMQGRYLETVTISNFVDIDLTNSYVQTLLNSSSSQIDAKIFGQGAVIGSLALTNTNTSSKFSVDVDEIQGATVRNTTINANRITGTIGLIGSQQTLRAKEIIQSGSAFMYVQGTGTTVIDVDYHYSTSSGVGVGAFQVGVNGKGKVIYNSKLTIAPNAPCIIFNVNGGTISADTVTISGNFYSGYFDGVVYTNSFAGSNKLGGRYEFSGYYKSTYNGNSPAIKISKDVFSSVAYFIFKNATLVAAGTGNSIANGSVITINARYYGGVFANNAVDGTISALVGSPTIDSNVL